MFGESAGLPDGGKDGVAVRKVRARELVEQAELKEFCRFLLIENVVSEKTYRLFLTLACLPANDRLGVNLKSLAFCCARKEIGKIRLDGVTSEELAALNELDSPYIPERYREVGHGLLNMHTRWKAVQAIKRSMFDAHLNSRKFLGSITLDDVLGGETK